MPHKDTWMNGRKLVSVTELLTIVNKPFLEKWKESLCCPSEGQCGFIKAKQVAEEAADLGNKVHEEVAAYFTDGVERSEQAWSKKIIEKIKAMEIKKHLIDPEKHLIDELSNLHGSPDFVGQIDKGIGVDFVPEKQIFIGDLKIKNQLDSLTALQGCGYRYLIKRIYKVDIRHMLILWAQKKTKSMLVKEVWYHLEEDAKAWGAVVQLWNALNPKRQVILHDC